MVLHVCTFLSSLCPLLHFCLPQLAQQGMNVVIISRSKADLDLVARGISKNLTYICHWVTSHLRSSVMLPTVINTGFQPQPSPTHPFSTGETTGKNVKVLVADLTKDDVFEEIEKELKDLNIGVLG